MLKRKFKANKVPPTSNNFNYLSINSKYVKKKKKQNKYAFKKNIYDKHINNYLKKK